MPQGSPIKPQQALSPQELFKVFVIHYKSTNFETTSKVVVAARDFGQAYSLLEEAVRNDTAISEENKIRPQVFSHNITGFSADREGVIFYR